MLGVMKFIDLLSPPDTSTTVSLAQLSRPGMVSSPSRLLTLTLRLVRPVSWDIGGREASWLPLTSRSLSLVRLKQNKFLVMRKKDTQS